MSSNRAIPDFSRVTETPLTRATRDQVQILYTRYDLAAKYSSGKDVLEVACGAGMGLGALARFARRTVGGDIDERNCAIAKETYCGRSDVEVQQFDAQKLPFSDASFDLVILFEALYYIPSPDSFFREARRVLRPGGKLLISTVNCRWGEFNPSPYSVRYLDAVELSEILTRHGFAPEILGGFPQKTDGFRPAITAFVRKLAIRCHLIPKTMKGKEWLKRMFYGRLQPIPAELAPDIIAPAPLDMLSLRDTADRYRFIYAIATLL